MMKRRTLLGLGAVATTIFTATRGRAVAHNLPPRAFGGPAYDAALNAKGTKGVFQSPNIEANVKTGDTLTHLLPLQVKNWLNAYQFSYEIPAQDLHVVVATYASANTLTYNDDAWKTYRFGEKYQIIDPATGAPAVRNMFWASRNPNGSTNPDDPKSVYQDVGIEALQKRGVVFLT